jgi:hypothetical protein
MNHLLAISVVLLLVGACSSISLDHFKQLQGPPEEFEYYHVPDPVSIEINSQSSLFPVFLLKNDGDLSWKGDLPVDSSTLTTISLVSKKAAQLNLEILVIEGKNITQGDGVRPSDVETSWLGFDHDNSIPVKTYLFKAPTRGLWKVRVTLENQDQSNRVPDLYLILFNESPYRISTHTTTFSNFVNEEIGLLANLQHIGPVTQKSSNVVPNSKVGDSFSFDADIIFPNGDELIVTMHDDGKQDDGIPNNGIYGARIKAPLSGLYTTQIIMRGQLHSETGVIDILRSEQHTIAVIERELELITPHKATFTTNDEMITIDLLAKVLKEEAIGKKYRAYAEVWGVGSDQQLKPVAWVSGMTIAKKSAEMEATLPLHLSIKWISRSQADFPLKLRNVYVQDVATNVVISRLDHVDVTMHVKHQEKIYEGREAHALIRYQLFNNHLCIYNGQIDEKMSVGPRPREFLARNNSTANHRVILVHGYCSGDCPFTVEDFTDHVAFLDAKASRTNDEFALLIAEAGKDLDSFSVVAHSQGGLAALHLLTFYWSKQDTASTNNPDHRTIQTIGSPWKGNSLAGTIAGLGKIFNVGCGENYDLTQSGSAQWLPTISMAMRAKVYYATTQYKSWSYCNLAANAVLKWPNDGN